MERLMSVKISFRTCLLVISVFSVNFPHGSLAAHATELPLPHIDRQISTTSAKTQNSINEYKSEDQRDFHRFITRPNIDAPTWIIRNYQNKSLLAPRYWFVAFYHGLDQHVPGAEWVGPHIHDADGELIWGGGSVFKHWNIFDIGVMQVEGEQKLTLLSAHERMAYILDNHYQVQKTVPLVTVGEGQPNMHAFHVIDDGTRALVINGGSCNTTKEISQQVGFNGSCFVEYQRFRELNHETPDSRPLFEWNARDWIGLDESTYRKYDGTIDSMCTMGWDNL